MRNARPRALTATASSPASPHLETRAPMRCFHDKANVAKNDTAEIVPSCPGWEQPSAIAHESSPFLQFRHLRFRHPAHCAGCSMCWPTCARLDSEETAILVDRGGSIWEHDRCTRATPLVLGYHWAMEPGAPDVADAVRALVDQYRTRCLWFLRPDYYPATPTEQLTVLGYIQRYGDVEAHRRASVLCQWLSRPSSAASAG